MPLEDVRGAQFIALATLLFFLPQLPHIPPPPPPAKALGSLSSAARSEGRALFLPLFTL